MFIRHLLRIGNLRPDSTPANSRHNGTHPPRTSQQHPAPQSRIQNNRSQAPTIRGHLAPGKTIRSKLEVQPSRKLEVTAARIAGRRAHRSKGCSVDTSLNASESNFIRYILAIDREDELHPLRRDVESPTDAGVHVIDARIS